MSKVCSNSRAGANLLSLARYFIGDHQEFLSPDGLKRNAEFITILTLSGNSASELQVVCEPYRFFFKKIDLILRNFPQYYRLILSLGHDLSLLYNDRNTYGKLCDYVVNNRLFEIETSDMRRLEAEYLINLHDQEWAYPDTALYDRMMRTISLDGAYFRQNRDLFYNFTHVIFYITAFGKINPTDLPSIVQQNLLNIGTIAFLAEDHDLLAEVCICLKYLDIAVPPIWSDFVFFRFSEYVIEYSKDSIFEYSSNYHSFLVSYWFLGIHRGIPAISCRESDKNSISNKCVRAPEAENLHQICFDLSQTEILDKEAAQNKVVQYCGIGPKSKYELCMALNSNFDHIINNMSCGLFRNYQELHQFLK